MAVDNLGEVLYFGSLKVILWPLSKFKTILCFIVIKSSFSLFSQLKTKSEYILSPFGICISGDSLSGIELNRDYLDVELVTLNT